MKSMLNPKAGKRRRTDRRDAEDFDPDAPELFERQAGYDLRLEAADLTLRERHEAELGRLHFEPEEA